MNNEQCTMHNENAEASIIASEVQQGFVTAVAMTVRSVIRGALRRIWGHRIQRGERFQ